MEYKGYNAAITFDDDAELFHGEVINTRDVITFQGKSVPSLKKAFKDSVDDYLEFCASKGKEPDKPFSGKFVIRVEPETHQGIYIKAKKEGVSINSFVTSILKKAANQ